MTVYQFQLPLVLGELVRALRGSVLAPTQRTKRLQCTHISKF